MNRLLSSEAAVAILTGAPLAIIAVSQTVAGQLLRGLPTAFLARFALVQQADVYAVMAWHLI